MGWVFKIIRDALKKPIFKNLLSGLPIARPPSTPACIPDLATFNDLHLYPILESIYKDILSANGRSVYYELLEDHPGFARYLTLIRDAVHLRDLEEARRQARLAFFINLYNVMVLHVSFKQGLPSSVWAKRKQMNGVYMQVGEHIYSLQSIFNGVLRGNKRGVDALWRPFGDEDPRLKVSSLAGMRHWLRLFV